jgi:hypothetical protein
MSFDESSLDGSLAREFDRLIRDRNYGTISDLATIGGHK